MMLSHRLNMIISIFLISISVSISASIGPTVDLGYATYQGTFDNTTGVSSFLSLRYASAPLGKLRFQAPAPPPRLVGIQPATSLPDQCMQSTQGLAPVDPSWVTGLQKRATLPPQSEDCLFADVYVPGKLEDVQGKNLPVIFWIHGGGYVYGQAASYNGAYVINDAGGDVVVVVVQYRLGLYGFLSGTEVKEKGALNAGLLDQEFALKWVQQHIHKFGGDPTKVTIWGLSSGAGSVLSHMVAHGGNTQPSLFRAAITSSTYLPSQYDFDAPIMERLFDTIASQAGCGSTNDKFTCLQDTDAATLQTVNFNLSASDLFGLFTFVPVVDGEFFLEPPMEAILAGKMNGEALLTFNNADEGSIFINGTFTSEQTLPEYVKNLFPLFNDAQVQATVAQYESLGDGNVTNQAILIMGDSIFVCPTRALLQGFKGPSWKGEFAFPPAYHGFDARFYWSPDAPDSAANASFAGSFTGFAKTLNPNFNPLPKSVTPFWPMYASEGGPGGVEMLFNVTESGEAVVHTFRTDAGLLERCGFWESMAPFTPQ